MYNNFCFIIYFSFINFVSCSLAMIFTLRDFCVPVKHGFLNVFSLSSRHELLLREHFLFYFNVFVFLYDYIYIYIYIYILRFSQNLLNTLPPASTVISFFQSFTENLNQKFVNIPHTKWVKNNGILRCSWSDRHYICIYIYIYIYIKWGCECKTTSVSHRLKW